LKALIFAIVLCVANVPVQPRCLTISGTAGHLSEWEFSGEVAERGSGATNKLFGSLIWKHVGLCSVSGPHEKKVEIRIPLAKSGPLSQAIIWLDGSQCVYTGDFAGGPKGHMDCPNFKGVPVSISIK
jgi:hypothetical protein